MPFVNLGCVLFAHGAFQSALEAAKASFELPTGRASRKNRSGIRLPSLIGDSRRAPSSPSYPADRSSHKSTTSSSGDSVDGSSTGRNINTNGSSISRGAAGDDDDDDDDNDLDTVMMRLRSSGPPSDVLKAARKERRRLQQMGERNQMVSICRFALDLERSGTDLCRIQSVILPV